MLFEIRCMDKNTNIKITFCERFCWHLEKLAHQCPDILDQLTKMPNIKVTLDIIWSVMWHIRRREKLQWNHVWFDDYKKLHMDIFSTFLQCMSGDPGVLMDVGVHTRHHKVRQALLERLESEAEHTLQVLYE